MTHQLTISELYSKYTIMPALALHQKRVASVASMIMKYMSLDDDSIRSACLLHDMGNIIKFDLDLFPDFVEPEGVEHWKNIQSHMIQTYGRDEHEASLRIAQEIGVSDSTIECIKAVGFSHSLENKEAPLAHQICAYADMRVAPHGVVTLQERLDEGRKRYAHRVDRSPLQHSLEELYDALFFIERQLEDKGSFDAHIITEASIAKLLPTWDSFVVC